MPYNYANRTMARAAASSLDLLDNEGFVVRQDPETLLWGWDYQGTEPQEIGGGAVTEAVGDDDPSRVALLGGGPLDFGRVSLSEPGLSLGALLEGAPTLEGGEAVLIGNDALLFGNDTVLEGEIIRPNEGLDTAPLLLAAPEASDPIIEGGDLVESSDDSDGQAELTVFEGGGETTTTADPPLAVVGGIEAEAPREAPKGNRVIFLADVVRLMDAATLATKLAKLGYAVRIRDAESDAIVDEVPAITKSAA